MVFISIILKVLKLADDVSLVALIAEQKVKGFPRTPDDPSQVNNENRSLFPKTQCMGVEL